MSALRWSDQPRRHLACLPAHSQRIAEEATQAGPANGTGPTSEAENWSILHRTGPHVWTDSVLKWMHGQGIGFHEALVPGG